MPLSVEVVGEPQLLDFGLPQELGGYYVLSPYVVFRDERFQMLLRLVNPDADASKKISRIHYASSTDGVRFEVGREVIAPAGSSDPDGAGCEDPTIAFDDDSYGVFYSGYNADRARSSMLSAKGKGLDAVRKAGNVLVPDDRYANPKQPALVATPRGFRMFFEYAHGGASHIGAADAPELDGPWTYAESPIVQRSDAFDSWHLSPAAAVRRDDGTHVLFYNGASKRTDWRINYLLLDETATIVLDRPQKPLLKPFGLEKGDSDIAFAASSPLDAPGYVWLYYSIADRKPYRARLRIAGAIADSASRKTAGARDRQTRYLTPE